VPVCNNKSCACVVALAYHCHAHRRGTYAYTVVSDEKGIEHQWGVHAAQQKWGAVRYKQPSDLISQHVADGLQVGCSRPASATALDCPEQPNRTSSQSAAASYHWERCPHACAAPWSSAPSPPPFPPKYAAPLPTTPPPFTSPTTTQPHLLRSPATPCLLHANCCCRWRMCLQEPRHKTTHAANVRKIC
jgi:hypothetical protein